MSEIENKPQRYEWGSEYLDMVKYGAINGQSPSYIAEFAGFKGELRRQFLQDITNPKTEIGKEYRKNRAISSQDIDTTLHFLQIQGDTDAMDVAIKRESLEYVQRIREDLFGI